MGIVLNCYRYRSREAAMLHLQHGLRLGFKERAVGAQFGRNIPDQTCYSKNANGATEIDP